MRFLSILVLLVSMTSAYALENKPLDLASFTKQAAIQEHYSNWMVVEEYPIIGNHQDLGCHFHRDERQWFVLRQVALTPDRGAWIATTATVDEALDPRMINILCHAPFLAPSNPQKKR